MKRTQYIIDKFYKEHEFEIFENRVELQNELSAFLIVNKLDDISDNEYLKIEAELNSIYLSGRSEHF